MYNSIMGTKLEKIIEYLNQHSALSLQDAEAIGASRHELKLWADKGAIKRIRRGIYSLNDATETAEETIVFLPTPCAMAGLSALDHWGYTNYVVDEVWVTVPLGTTPIKRSGIHCTTQVPDVYKLGLMKLETPHGTINVFDREKSVLDAIRGNYLDDEEKFRVLKRWRRDPNRNRKNLGAYASKIKVRKDFMDWFAFLEAQE